MPWALLAAAVAISIHALLTEGDVMPNEDLRDVFAISIHALLTEGDALMRRQKNLRGDISIHALLTEGDTIARGTYGKGTISIHALLTEGDGPAPVSYTHLIESWMNATGDVDDFIFYPEEEFLKYHSER